MPIINLEALVETLVALPAETEWVEFKHNRFDPQEVGEYVSALANGAILTDQRSAYLVFGIEDGSHQVVGTTADPMKHKVGGEAFINWLARGLDLLLPGDAFAKKVITRYEAWAYQQGQAPLIRLHAPLRELSGHFALLRESGGHPTALLTP